MKYLFIFLNLVLFSNLYSQNKETVTLKINRDSIYHKEAPVYFSVDEMPKFIGGAVGLIKFYQEHSDHVINAGKKNSNTVYYQIVINKDGSVSDFKIIRGCSKELDKETERIIKLMPKWKPGKKDGKFVRVQEILTISYCISPH